MFLTDDGVNKGEGVFVHCAQGRSRSASMLFLFDRTLHSDPLLNALLVVFQLL
jgi:hypothetical protein